MRTRIFFFPLFLFLLGTGFSRSQVSVVGELSQDREARPGETYNGTITIKNDTNEPQEAKVYQTDYLFFSNGTNSYGDPGSHARSNARWITFGPSYVELPPQALVTIQYTVTVPVRKDSLIGSYWSMLMVEGIAKGSPESSRDPAKKADMGIMQTIRYGIQIATHIQGTGERLVEFKDPQVVNNGGKRLFQVDVENTGSGLKSPLRCSTKRANLPGRSAAYDTGSTRARRCGSRSTCPPSRRDRTRLCS